MRPLAVALLVVLGLALGVALSVLVDHGHGHEHSRGRTFPPGNFGRQGPVHVWHTPPGWAR